MSNKPHHRPHPDQRRASRTTRLLVVTLIVAGFAFILALELTGHIIITGRR